LNKANAQQWFAKIWAFEKVLSFVTLISNRIKVKLKFFKSPYFGKPLLVVRNIKLAAVQKTI